MFGTLAGTLYGAVGLLLSALVLFVGARWAGRDAVAAHYAEDGYIIINRGEPHRGRDGLAAMEV